MTVHQGTPQYSSAASLPLPCIQHHETLTCLLFLAAPPAPLITQVRDRELQGVRASLKKALEDKESSVGATKEKVCDSVRVDGEVCVSSVCVGRGITSWDSLLTRTGFTPPRPQL